MPLILFIIIPIVELALLILIGGYIGVFNTVALVLLTGLAGAILARRQGFSALTRIRANLEQGTPPGDEMLRGALILLAGLLLIFPGVLTDLAGLLLFVPPVRTRSADALKAFFLSRIRRGDVRIYRIR
ncbi:FxsA cytoplasmic membrane protein [Dehalogenimonas lykanthroporepellens BL-DC-9]|nr:FxsA cytoplasmic membrane protein [Dehalogenimonas lykanthroporepellens BL-DC-9]